MFKKFSDLREDIVRQFPELNPEHGTYKWYVLGTVMIATFMAVLDERQAQGIEDEDGPEASPLPADMNKDEYGARVRARLAGWETIPPPGGYQLFTPIIDTFLKGNCSGW